MMKAGLKSYVEVDELAGLLSGLVGVDGAVELPFPEPPSLFGGELRL
jgi:hypothetical protein